MKKLGRKIPEEAFIAYYGMGSSDYLLALSKENGFTHSGLDNNLCSKETKGIQTTWEKRLDIQVHSSH